MVNAGTRTEDDPDTLDVKGRSIVHLLFWLLRKSLSIGQIRRSQWLLVLVQALVVL